MKRGLLSLLLSLLLVSVLCASGFGKTQSRESKRLDEGKITKNEAQHLVLKKFPGAKIRKCELKPAGKHGVWMVELVKSGDAGPPMKLTVDGRTGRIGR